MNNIHETTPPVRVLAQHHQELDERLNHLLVRVEMASPTELRAQWTAFEGDLLRHFELEESELLSRFAKHDPDEARALLAEHCEIRNALLEIDLSLDLHCLRAEAVRDLVGGIKQHARREEATLYVWAERHVRPSAWQQIKRGLYGAAQTGRRILHVGGGTP